MKYLFADECFTGAEGFTIFFSQQIAMTFTKGIINFS